MNILVIETSAPVASLCLSKESDLLFSTGWEAERNHDAHLFPALEHALHCLHGESIDVILVGSGPGSYGGVRVALAAAEGIALVHGARVGAICSWLGLPLPQGPCIVTSDARRNGWTVASFLDGIMQGSFDILTKQQLLEHLRKTEGPCLSIEKEAHLREQGVPVDSAGLHAAAEGLLRAWLRLQATERENLLSAPAAPIYVRPPHITQARRKPWES